MSPKSSNRQSGFSLIELLLVLAIVAALAVAAFIIYPRVQAGRQATFETQVLSSAQAGVKALYTSGNFFTVSNTVATQATFFPSSMLTVPSTITNQFGGAVTVGPSLNTGLADAANPAQFFSITYNSVPTEVCIKLAASAVENFGAVFVGAPGVPTTVKNEFTGVASNPGGIPALCGAATTVNITFVSN